MPSQRHDDIDQFSVRFVREARPPDERHVSGYSSVADPCDQRPARIWAKSNDRRLAVACVRDNYTVELVSHAYQHCAKVVEGHDDGRRRGAGLDASVDGSVHDIPTMRGPWLPPLHRVEIKRAKVIEVVAEFALGQGVRVPQNSLRFSRREVTAQRWDEAMTGGGARTSRER